MKKIIAALIACYLFVPAVFSQDDDEIRPRNLGVSFFLNDFATASRIRSTSLNSVLRDKKWAKLREMTPGLAVTYFQGLTKHIDFAGADNIGMHSILTHDIQAIPESEGNTFLCGAIQVKRRMQAQINIL